MGVLVRNMRKTSTMEGLNSRGIGRVERYEYPLEAIRELLVNALMHRDYSPGARGSQVQVELYTNRLVVRSPGGIYGAVTIRDFGQPGVSSTRNSYLASILTDLPDPGTGRLIAENRASGIPTVLRALKEAGLPAPQFADRLLYVQVTLMQPPQGTSSTEQKTAPEDQPQRVARSKGTHSDGTTTKPSGTDASLDGLSERQAGIVRGLRAQGEAASIAYIQEHWGRGASRTSITNDLRRLVEAKLIVATAPPRSKNRKYRAA